ncbi:winged helix-turn-helix domain-containing protein [Streptomyces sp. NPDC047928]|uniref:winged helix-turn-helix domain-containing protein n=1 Tax=unclassified Streptomyces TaxID=2593676 RepID=UPI003712345C
MDMLSAGGGGSAFRSWRKKVGGMGDVRSLVKLAQVVRPFPDMDQVLRRTSRRDPAGGPAAVPPQVVRDLEEFRRVAVAPYWKAIAKRLDADRVARGRIMLSEGVGKLLTTLHPAIRWNPPVLEIPGTGEDMKLEATGLALVPSLFLAGRPPVLTTDGQGPGGTVSLIYPIPVRPEWAESLWESREGTDNALDALVGRTRAAVLEILTSSLTTTEVGERVGISSAAASQHTSILRAAGLITTLRTFNKVQHTITPLGGALLHGEATGRL